MNSTQGAPRIIGRYAIFDPIASGGMASVHLGRLMGAAGFSRTVAIKRLHENLAADPEFVAMFLDEARIVARVRHPNVVPTLDVVASDRELLLVMEYIVGESLSLLLKRARAAKEQPPIPILVDVMASVLNGLHAAHEATDEKGEPLNIVHRDVSPQNILVGVDGVARVLDFGVAKAVGRMHHTRTGEVKGKIRYMAPEQVHGKEVTSAADVYSASIVLWEALAGQRLFSGDTDAEVLYRVLQGCSDPPSRFRQDVPAALDQIVLRGLEKDPANRFPTAKAMANALEAAVEPVTRGRVSAWVLASAGEDIRHRRDRLAEVESGAYLIPGAARASSPPLRLPIPIVPPGASDSSTITTAGQTRSTSESPPASLGPSLRRRSRAALAWSLVAGVVLVLALASSAFVGRPSKPAPSAQSALPSVAAQPSIEAPATTEAPLPAPAASSPLPVASSEARADASAPPRKATATPMPTAASRPSPKPPSSRPKPHDLNSLLDSR
jgi:serine/threonine-protein kinase